ncbi:hypothetical protein N657DRAFT_685186 [Parathielavia appendiculata]|uniref:BZIP domain-containing protein n=1 Tax=Parathielavia appendiculata TaxID=2587402 RepID=A0AAN6TQW9_9PEZI|nr:hypothetical protein N657DRAFT_685186 [Parathielavia appendiculata]
MRYTQGDLPILSAEVYDDSASLGSSTAVATRRKAQGPSPSSRLSEDSSRKRARTEFSETVEPDDEKKRSRGRPRLDTKDETAADRRRTQIRLAQRAYRNRKENAIQTLEKKVQQLKDTNEEMSNAFMQLHDFALANGLLDQVPEFGRQLRKTTEKFLSLAREASDDDGKDDEPKTSGNGSGADSRSSKEHNRSGSPGQAGVSPRAAGTSPSESGTDNTSKTLMGGLTISYEPVTQPSFSTPSPVFSNTYEILTYPTLDNASFPTLSDPGLAILSERQQQQQQQQQPPTPSPYLTLPMPDSYAPMESTFGRRLQRYAIERAFMLITMPSPPQDKMLHIFGFSLLLESPATISRRLARQLGRDDQTSLHNWQYPFLALGGAGTHFRGNGINTRGVGVDVADGGSGGRKGRRVGNQGTVDVGRPAETTGFATGPFDEVVNSLRDRVLDEDMRMALPGFAGEYFDCDEAEMYLYQRGVVIPPGSDVVTVDVDAALLEENGGGYGAGDGWMSGLGDIDIGDAGSGGTSSNLSPSRSDGSEQGQEGTGTGWAVGGGADLVDPAIADMFSQPNPFMPITQSGRGSMFPFGALAPDGAGSAGYGVGATQPNPSRRRVVIDAMRLIKEMTSRAICLGRSPGLRQADIDAAVLSTVRAGLL